MNLEKNLQSIEIVLERMKAKAETFEFKIEARENFFNNKSESWQESEKGDNHQTKTDEMQDLFDAVTAEIDTIEAAIEQLRELTN